MRRVRRAVTIFFAILVVGIVALVLRTLDAMGVFSEVAQVACVEPMAVSGVVGPGDLQYDAPTNSLFISATDERLWPEHPSAKDGIYLYHPGKADPPVKLTGMSKNFHPFDMSLFRAADGSLTLMVINMLSLDKASVDIFDVTDPGTAKTALHEREAIASDMMPNPSGIVAVDKSRFYVANTHTSKTDLGTALEIHLMLPRSNVVYFDGADFRVVAGGLHLASGVGKSPDGTRIYVSETTGREVRTYERNLASGDLLPLGELPIDSGLDTIDVTANGNFYVVAQPKLFALVTYRLNPAKPAPSQIFEFAVDKNGIPQSAKLVYSGTDIGAAGGTALVGNRLMIGSGFGAGMLSCTAPK